MEQEKALERKKGTYINLPMAEIIRAYVDDRQTPETIGARFGVHMMTIHRRLRAAGVKCRSHSESMNGVNALAKNPRWKGGTSKRKGYVVVRTFDHPPNRYVGEHVLIAEKALGKHLPQGVVVHHANRIRGDNRNGNLVICQDNAYHQILHARMRIRDAGGNPNTDRFCSVCKRVKPSESFHRTHFTYDGRVTTCAECTNRRNRQHYDPKKEAERKARR